MDNSRFIVLIMIYLATFGIRYLVWCEVFTESEQSAVDETIEELMNCKQIPGLGLSITKGDKFLAKGYGVSDAVEGIPMTKDTVTCIGSTTKAFTSALLGALITRDKSRGGSLSWTTSLREIFGDNFGLTSDPVISSQVTLADILSHRTGVASADALLMAQIYTENNRDFLLRRLYLMPKKGVFRGQFSYNNLMYGLAGLAAEAIGKKPYYELLKEMLLDPLGMKSAVLVDDLNFTKNTTSKPHQITNRSFRISDTKFYRLGSFSPAGGICLSPADFNKWLFFLNSRGRTQSKKTIISSMFFLDMILPTVALDILTQYSFGLYKNFPEPSYTSWYGLGWFGRFYRANVDFFHGGSMFSYSAVVVTDPETQIGIAVTQNGLYPISLERDLYPLAYYLKDILQGQIPWLNKSTICSYPEPWQRSYPIQLPTQNVKERYVGDSEEFVGTFGHTLFGEVKVTDNNGSLDLQWGNIIKGTLYDFVKKKLNFKLRLQDETYQVIGYELGSIDILFQEKSSGKYTKVEIKFSKVMEIYDFSRQISFFSPSTSSSTVKLCFHKTKTSLLYTLFLILINVFSSL
ncbi:uncharacterized protein LOC133181862 [Saccostrea echinata]|uniref:uncharacterized protein LOC133181862 n=1 Tax=Saccostrea echinata TaxID=191078 RepID=UPI002A82A20D|nr:uncharacterized protein LOC133181862 [Saccostrea echinata]